jgi:hypothetical protein
MHHMLALTSLIGKNKRGSVTFSGTHRCMYVLYVGVATMSSQRVVNNYIRSHRYRLELISSSLHLGRRHFPLPST